ncbi:MAG: endonuclease/exonuclease/phosphatase family protein, partial [Pseudomonadota bacterium]
LESKGDDPQTPAISVTLDAFSRPVLHFVIRPRREGKPIHVFVCHFKSKAPTQIWREGWYDKETYSKHSVAIGAGLSTIRRTAEATALRMIITGYVQGSDTPVVVLGDLNDGIHSNTLNVVTGQPNYLLSGLSKGGSDRGLYSAATLQQLRSERDVYYSHIHQNRMEILDHILVSEEFYDNSRDRIWAFRGMEVMNDHLHRGDHKETGTGDHGIIMASFEYRPVN